MRIVNAKVRRSVAAGPGYLLLEVLLALVVLSIVVVMVFQIIQIAVRITSEINALQIQQRKADGICELLRRNILTMPGSCQFQTRTNNGALELIFRDAPFNFSWNNQSAQFGTIVISSRPQPNGRLALSILQDSGDAVENYVDAGKEQKASWVPLLNDVELVSWRFFDPRLGKWYSDWRDAAAKPSLIEITFRLAGRNHTERGVFLWPIAQTIPSAS